MSTLTEAPLFLSVGETASLLGISDDLVYDLIARGELPSADFGRRRLVPRQAIDLVVERALDGFDPDRLASAVGLSPSGARPTGQATATADTGG